MEPTLRQIRYFIAAANAGQISRAAMDINISQSVITTAIKSLEEMVGTPLFERHAAGMALTYEGSLFLNHAVHIMESVDEAVRIPRRIKEDLSGTVNLAVSFTVIGYFLPKLMARFMRTFPNIKIHMTEANRTEIEEGLVTGGFDLAVMLTSNIINHEDLSQTTLIQSRRRLWVSSNHKFTKQAAVTLQDISTEPYIMLTVDEASNTTQRYWNKTPFKPNTVFRTSSVEAVRSMVANDMGVAILSDMVYRPWSLEGRRVDVIDVDETIPTMDVGVTWRTNATHSDVTKALIDFMHLSMGAE
ncbi:LysR family transcriptional regulator [Candidatus Puniceispirillum marinum]|uniref:Transcriptional regulator, LysR family n=1 Tax=Puniceispirillum marinum (strain IMCC1322) TaxID=488538 RepID=D5BMG8_PUNMI|nr:LysR family transcriptional regulator [Candidatus Puniceispirillum marinum]ADE40011.1 transcriptional regulator, LysR family [Candidatus Puniceispirillum marinum IMCC1322]